jgi:Mrp family chromosome partitioning ATPase
VDVAGAVRSAPIPGLSILPAGNWTQATHQMLVGSRWRHLKRELKEQFDFVVIDTSPLLLVSDTMLLAREADGVVLSVLLGVSQIARVAETVNRLNAVGARLSGVVVNNVRSAAAQHADAYRAKYYASGSAALLPEAGLVEETDSLPKNG